MKIFKNNSSNETISNSNTKKYYKAISLTSLSTLALTLALPTDIVQAIIGRSGSIRFYGSSASRVIKAPHSRNSNINSKFNVTNLRTNTATKPIIFYSSEGHRVIKAPYSGKTGTTGATIDYKNNTLNGTKPKTSVLTQTYQTNDGDNISLGSLHSNSSSIKSNSWSNKLDKLTIQTNKTNDGDNISLGSINNSVNINTNGQGTLNGNTSDNNNSGNNNKLSTRNKIILGATASTAVLGTTIGLAVGLTQNKDNSSSNKTTTTTPPNSVPTPDAPTYLTNSIINNPDGFLFIDEKA